MDNKFLNKRIISFSLWGNSPKYIIGAIRNAELAKKIYRGWICRFYVGQSTLKQAGKYIQQLSTYPNVEIVVMPETGDWSSMFWRFLPISDPDVDMMLSRDTDSRLSYREKAAVKEWLKSEKKFHIIRDHPYHDFKILGGLWGARRGILFDMKDRVQDYKKGNFYQVDQNFLSECIFPQIENDAFIHDEFRGGNRIHYKRKNYEFIGEVFDEFDCRHPEQWQELKKAISNKPSRRNKIVSFLKMQVHRAFLT